jgi:hypothetical protein
MRGRFSLCESAKANKGATKNLINGLIFKMNLGALARGKRYFEPLRG